MQPQSKPHGFWYIIGALACVVLLFALLDGFITPLLRALMKG